MKQTIFIGELPPMLNGSGGLMNMHWSTYRKVRDAWVWLMAAEKPKKHKGRVNVCMTRISTATPDPDNVSASFKVIGDALEKNGILKDDSFNTINDFKVRWKKAPSQKKQGVKIEIEDV